MSEGVKGPCHDGEDTEAVVPHPHPPLTDGGVRWANGQCVLAMPSHSLLNPSFDLTLCHTLLNQDGFQIPASDLIGPLMTALDPPSVRRYIVFNSSLFNFFMAPIMYMVTWCALFSTVHRYMTVTDYWLLCLGISLVAILLTIVIIFVLHRGNNEMTVNVDVRLIQVNERLVRHNLLVGVADWVQNCSGTLQLIFIYWDMTSCLRTLTQTLENNLIGTNEFQRRLSKRLSHLVLQVKVDKADADASDRPTEVLTSDEERPLLAEGDIGRSTFTSQREETKLAKSFNLIPEPGLPAQAAAYQLLVTYSAAYARLLGSKRLSGPAQHQPRPRRNHCSTTAPHCLCQYIKAKVL
ncbi:transmembrane protein 268 [Gadus morhua]|uniref:Transmembrane protein 268 n=1 Tax=Gadus morhua TaxID=8049 RepID=A0A8C5FM70_GADMO|nr:transmembrane protein 268 [Gadus morhua]XP_030203492.1 transmembrane protein 268 [Gadus morhua]